MSGLDGLPNEVQSALRGVLERRGISEGDARVSVFAIPLGAEAQQESQSAPSADQVHDEGAHVDCTPDDCGFALAKELADNHNLNVSDDVLFQMGIHMISTSKIGKDLHAIDETLCGIGGVLVDLLSALKDKKGN